MNWLSMGSLLAALIYFYLGLQAVGRDHKSITNRIFTAFCLSLALWAFAYSFVYGGSLENRSEVLFWYNVASIGWILFPANVLHFALVLTGSAKQLGKKKGFLLITLIYLPTLVLLLQSLTGPLFLQDFLQTKAGLVEVVDKDSFWFVFYNIYLLINVSGMFVLLHQWGRKSSYYKEKFQSRIIVLSGIVVLAAGTATNLFLPALGYKTPALAAIFSIVWAAGIWIAIEKYKFMSLHFGMASDQILETVKDYIVLINAEAKIIKANQELKNELKYGDSIIGFPLSSLFYEKEMLDGYLDQLKTGHSPEESKELHFLRNNDSSLVPVRVSYSSVIDRVGDILGAVVTAQDLRQTRQIQEQIMAIRNLLNNAGQGFLTFGWNLLVNKEYSAECVKIFGAPITGKKISDLIFPENGEEKKMLEEILLEISVEKNENKQDIYLSLLPEEVLINDLNICLEYKLIKSKLDAEQKDLLMLILTDITEKRKLEALMVEEKNLFEMIVRIVSNIDDFNATLREYEEFCHTCMQEIAPNQASGEFVTGIYRHIHTFKGSFHQFGMLNMVHKLHELETKLLQRQKTNIEPISVEELRALLAMEALADWLEEDLLLLKTILGDSYFLRENTLVIDAESLQEIEARIIETLSPTEISLIIPELKKLLWKPFRESLKVYPEYISRLSSETEKLVYPLEIEGGNIKVDPEIFRDFVKLLGHIFRNALEHGIENPEERVAAGKDERGRIHTRIFQEGGWIILEISDDGRGISIEKTKKKAMEMGKPSRTMPASEQEILQLIFEDHFSTQESLSELSGRGVGLAAVKNEVEKLGGKIELQNSPGEGITFSFYLPLETGLPLRKLSYFEVINLFLHTARSILHEQAGLIMDTPANTSINVLEQIELFDITTILPLRGIINGKIILSASRELCNHMLDNFALWEVKEAERENCYGDLLTELLNIITGNFLQKLPGGELIITEMPEKLHAEHAFFKNNGGKLLTYRINVERGNLIFAFIPGKEDFFFTPHHITELKYLTP